MQFKKAIKRKNAMNLKDIGKQIVSFAPGIAAAIGGPVGGIASMGIKALSGALGVDENITAIENSLNSLNPEIAMALKKADNDFLVQMKTLEVDVFSLEVKDKQNARDREKTVGSMDNRILAYVMVLAFIGLVFAVVLYDGFARMSTLQVSLVSTAIGIVSTKVNTVYEYYFGSSKGGDEAAANLAHIIKNK